MPDRKTGQMDLARFGEIVAAYGADPGRWPPGERAAAERLRAGSDDARQLHADAAALDTLMNLTAAPAPSPELMAQVLAAAGRRRWRDGFAALWPFKTIWRPASGFAVAAALGIVLGAAVPETVLPDVGEIDMIGDVESLALGFDISTEPGT